MFDSSNLIREKDKVAITVWEVTIVCYQEDSSEEQAG